MSFPDACLARSVRALALTFLLALMTVSLPAAVAHAGNDGEYTSLRASWPSASKVALNTRLSVTGTVSAPGPRTVSLEHQTHNGWQSLATATTAADGTFTVPIPTSWLAQHRLRVAVAASETHQAAVSAPEKPVTVTPAYLPLGSAKHYELYGWRFDPCQTITYRLNKTRMPKGAAADIHKAFAMVAQATGLKFKYVGTSTAIPWKGAMPGRYTSATQVTNADFLVGYATPRQVPALAGWTTGIGGPTEGSSKNASGSIQTTSAQVVIDSTEKVRGGFGAGFTRGELLLHEIGHGVGLDHSMTPDQVMSYNTLAKDRFGAGDLAGLRQVGRSAGCFVDTNR